MHVYDHILTIRNQGGMAAEAGASGGRWACPAAKSNNIPTTVKPLTTYITLGGKPSRYQSTFSFYEARKRRRLTLRTSSERSELERSRAIIPISVCQRGTMGT